jgi:3-deoxy-D-manno-octulosonic-acid transferase
MLTRFDALYVLASPFLGSYLLYRRLTRGKYRESARGMLGRTLPQGASREVFAQGCVWVHAVSVGETVAAKALMPYLHGGGGLFPGLPILATTVTETGQAHARKILTEAALVHYFPLDLSWIVRRFFDCFRPRCIILLEGELWPNFLIEAARREIPVFLINGKLSERSYHRYGLAPAQALLAPAFAAIRAFCMQNEESAARMAELSHRPADVHVTGNCKFDAPMPTLDPGVAQLLRERYRLGSGRPMLVVGSTHPGEEEIVLRAFREVRRRVPGLQMILSPRHPDRFAEVFDLCRRDPANGTVSRATNPSQDSPDVFVLDTMGELARIYGLADVAVVAGSFPPCVGGHNLLEAAAHAVPVVTGPDLHAQKELDRLFADESSGCVRTTAEGLAATLTDLFLDAEKRRRLGEAARATALRNQGSARASIEAIRPYLAPREAEVPGANERM